MAHGITTNAKGTPQQQPLTPKNHIKHHESKQSTCRHVPVPVPAPNGFGAGKQHGYGRRRRRHAFDCRTGAETGKEDRRL